MTVEPTSVDEVTAGLRSVGYLPGESTALVSYLAARLGKPVLVEGPAGVGKTELAKALSRYLQRDLVRLQCYEGLDEAKALYEWNDRKQLLRIQAEADVTGWELLWNENYAGKILMFDNSRDAFGIAEYLLGYSVNTTDSAELQACADKLAEQKPVVQQYVMDQIFDAMENEEAYIAPYYDGDYLTMVEENPDLKFYQPEHQGFNLFVDGCVIPTCAKEKDAAETFINFLLDPEICAQNLDFIGYSVPETEAKQYLDPELASNPVAYPSQETLRNATSFDFLPEDTSREMESLFMTVRNG